MSNAYILSNWTGRGLNKRAPTASNMAAWFTPRIPMCEPTYDPEKMIVMADIPVKLKAAQDDGLENIGIECVKQNAEVVLHFFESVCAEHVIDMQMEARLVRKLTQRNPNATEAKDAPLVPAGRLARSSLMAQDICGDEPIPEPESTASESDEANAPAEDAEGASATQASKKKKKEKKHSRLQLLRLEIQDKTYLYLTVHVYRMVTPFFQDLLKSREK